MKFLNLEKIAVKYGFARVGNNYGSWAVTTSGLRKLAKKGFWVGVNDEGELKLGKGFVLDGSVTWLDTLAGDFANGRVTIEELQ